MYCVSVLPDKATLKKAPFFLLFNEKMNTLENIIVLYGNHVTYYLISSV